jgi:hypothetical protein
MGPRDAQWGKAFRDLLDVPRISPILEQLIGDHRHRTGGTGPPVPTFRIDHVNVHNRCKVCESQAATAACV